MASRVPESPSTGITRNLASVTPLCALGGLLSFPAFLNERAVPSGIALRVWLACWAELLVFYLKAQML